jgi:rRNA maturation endonuclease Nob1
MRRALAMPRMRNMEMVTPILAVQLNLLSFLLGLVGFGGLLILVSALHKAPVRPCHQCGRRVPITNRICRYCGYDFSPVRFNR